MAEYFQKVLTDGREDVYEENYQLSSRDLLGYEGPDWRITKFALKGGKQHGVDIVEIDNGHLTVAVVPTRGMGILEAFTDEAALGWDSPVRQVVHPAYVDEESRGGIGWLEGFNELICRCGLAFHGAPGTDTIITNTGAERQVVLPMHGTIANVPALRVAVRIQVQPPYELAVVGEVYDTQMFGPAYRLVSTVSTTPGSNSFAVSDVVENLKASPEDLELLYHCNYGPPILGEGTRFLAPVEFACPRDARAQEGGETWDVYGPPERGFAEQCYYLRLHADDNGRTVVALVGPEGELAATIRYSVQELPAFTIWKNTAAEADGYVTGLEPGTDYPNSRFFERRNGRVIQLPGGGRYETSLEFGLISGADDVAALKAEISSLTEGKETTILGKPDPEHCPI